MMNRPLINTLWKGSHKFTQRDTRFLSQGEGGFLAALPGQTALREGRGNKHKHTDANKGPLGTPITSQRIEIKCNTQLLLYSVLKLIQINCTAAKCSCPPKIQILPLKLFVAYVIDV